MRTNRLYTAIFSSVGGRLLSYVFQFITLAVFSRIFSPAEFGVIAAIQVFVIFFQLFSEIGLGPALINAQKLSAKEINGIFSFTLLLGLVLAVIFEISSFAIVELYQNEVYAKISIYVSLSIILNSLVTLPLASFNKSAQFVKVAVYDVFAQILSFALTIIVWKYSDGVTALASRITSYALFRFLILWYRSDSTVFGRAKLALNISGVSKIMSFSSYQIGFGVINYFARNLDNILIAKYIGTSPLGVYDKAYQIMRYPLQLTSFSMGTAIQAVLNDFRDDLNYISKEHNKLASRLLILSIPLSLAIYTNSKAIVLVLLGDQWNGVAKLLEIFSLSLPFQMVMATSGAFFNALNKPKLYFIAGVVGSMIFVTNIIFSTLYFGDINSIAKFVAISFVMNFFFVYHILFKYGLRTSTKEFYNHLIKVVIELIVPSVMFLVAHYNLISPFIDNAFGSLVGSAFVIILCFFTKATYVKHSFGLRKSIS